MWFHLAHALLVFCFWIGATQAANPTSFATIDRSGWPRALTSEADFDMASRAEILMFSKVLLNTEGLDAENLKQRLDVKSVDIKSVEQVRQRFWQRLLDGYGKASANCPGEPFCPSVRNLAELRELAASFTVSAGDTLGTWVTSSQHFHEQYLNEQLRLAALFPKISSEIQSFNDAELNGDELGDRQFLLTFDDGPSAVGGHTETVTSVLRTHGMHGMFFVLGGSFQVRLQKTSAEKLSELYRDQCVSLHGWEHKSHSHWSEWQSSVVRTAALVNKTLPSNFQPLFRPPYGQRLSDSAAFFKTHDIKVMLWNIDSQDWSKQISSRAAAQRVQTLMLLWRHGIILFHDIHDKAPNAVSALIATNKGNGVQWQDCQTQR
ncbi:polysaccharide deacetylase family protein [Pseudomonas sp. OV226]|uniref:polysaccharide deacetylase family protein n=1 Tax=Pseudomonas sp. OV226 TaxID=2135588 RepID=UPI000D6DBEB3|nr:polysaccharide deacetylase family protein [Pseudomonas sp. OV226]PWK30247.1 peptidoglycan/xylan/chitin deacetylase (PgdA/CDA1 family) [Pseudomonas sp. OV226]